MEHSQLVNQLALVEDDISLNDHNSREDAKIQTFVDEPSQISCGSMAVQSAPKPFNTSSFYQKDTAVKFVLSSGMTFASAFKLNASIGKLKELVSNVLDINQDTIKLKCINNEKELSDFDYLVDLTTDKEFIRNPTINILLESKFGENALIEMKVRENIPSLDVITAHLFWEHNLVAKNVTVEIEYQCCPKEWLGGYRNKRNGIEYHHAYSQTRPHKKVYDQLQFGMSLPLLIHRDTQTVFKPKHKEIDTCATRGIQTTRLDLYIPSNTDKILIPRPYQSVIIEGVRGKINEQNAAVVIQRAIRNWLLMRYVKRVTLEEREKQEERERLTQELLQLQALKEQRILTRAAFPTKRDDFYVLYLMIEKWLKKENDRIVMNLSKVPQKACKYLLLDKEIKLLFTIEKHRIEMKKESLKQEEMRFLEMSARPYTFKNSKGWITSIDDLNTQRAREFKEVYSQLVRNTQNPHDRVGFLIVFRNFMSGFKNYEYLNDLVALVNREINLIAMGTKENFLKGLRTRIEQLYLHFLRQEEFNPKCVKYKIPNWPKTVDALYQCKRCKKMLPPSKFPVHIVMKSYQSCTSCTWLNNIGHKRVDMAPYLKLLQQVRQAEVNRCCHSSVCFLLQEIGMSYLTNVIWHGHSAISECNSLGKLSHVRWLHDLDWSPWNTILLTEQEAKYHMSIPDVNKFYSKTFIETVQRRHEDAKLHFAELVKLDQFLRCAGEWETTNDSGPYFHHSYADWFASQHEYDNF